MHCVRWPQAVRRSLTARNSMRWAVRCCKVQSPTASAPSCGRSSECARSSSVCTVCVSVKCTSGACWGRWASARKSLSAAPLSATTWQCWSGNARLGPRSKKCVAERRLIVFIDESGLSERPTRVRTWALKGCTPVVQFHFNWKHISAVAGLTRSNFLFRLYDGAVKSAQIVEFLKALRSQLKRKLLIVWDGAAQHKSRIVRQYLDSTQGALQMALLPAYAPDLNPVEYLWAWLKRHALANFCPTSLRELKTTARNKLRSGQRRQSIITACWKQAELW